ncbi:MAG: stage II sporulation protein M [Nanoarchaeota archaeon]|nr:stage II sporulation protein M [Nanoarchaeota archaeon]
MVLESLINGKNAEKMPFKVFLIGIIYASVGIFFELFVFHGKIQGLFVSIVVFASIPLMHKLIKIEEKRDFGAKKRNISERSLLKEHRNVIAAFIALFLGFLIAFSGWFIFLPEDSVNEIFKIQLDEVASVQNAITGNAVNSGKFSEIFVNNLKVLIFSFIFSLFFGAGAIFILAWNASIIATALGSFVRNFAESSNSFISFIGTYSYGFFGFMFHGIFEIASYLVAGLAGGIISVALIRHDFSSKSANTIINDAGWLVGLSLALLVVAGTIEVYLFPIIFV